MLRKHAFDLNDQSGKKTKLTLWYTPGNDAYGLLTKSERMIHSVNQLMEGDSEVCHFHSKLMQKEPRVGGAWEWHQDYGYWYKNEFLFPDQMVSVMIAITEANKENGCLPVKEVIDLAKKTGGTTEFIIEQESYQGKTPLECAKEDLAVMKGWGY